MTSANMAARNLRNL